MVEKSNHIDMHCWRYVLRVGSSGVKPKRVAAFLNKTVYTSLNTKNKQKHACCFYKPGSRVTCFWFQCSGGVKILVCYLLAMGLLWPMFFNGWKEPSTARRSAQLNPRSHGKVARAINAAIARQNRARN